MADAELLPCPFCKNADLCTEMGSTPSPGDYIMCDGPDGCGAMISRVDTQDDDLIGAWNRRAAPPSPSTAPEVPPFPEPLTLADVDYATNTPASWDPDYRRTWQQLQVAQATIRELRAYARQLRALASRPAEVDDEGLPPLPEPEVHAGTGDGLPDLYTAEQYRQGQRDAVAADRARRGVKP